MPLRSTSCRLDTDVYWCGNFPRGLTVDRAFLVLQGRESFSKEILDERHQRADDWHRQGAVKARTSRPAVPINCATYAQDVIEGRVAIQPSHQHTHGSPMLFGPASVVSGSLATDRERQIAQVFQPSHRYGHRFAGMFLLGSVVDIMCFHRNCLGWESAQFLLIVLVRVILRF